MQAYTSKTNGEYRQRKLPYLPIFLLAHFNHAIASIIPGKPWEPTLTPYGLRQITSSLTLNISGAQTGLNWQPAKTFEEGMEELE